MKRQSKMRFLKPLFYEILYHIWGIIRFPIELYVAIHYTLTNAQHPFENKVYNWYWQIGTRLAIKNIGWDMWPPHDCSEEECNSEEAPPDPLQIGDIVLIDQGDMHWVARITGINDDKIYVTSGIYQNDDDENMEFSMAMVKSRLWITEEDL